jgi:hypothetical protein
VTKFYFYPYKIRHLKPKEMDTVGMQSWPVFFSADRTLGLWVWISPTTRLYVCVVSVLSYVVIGFETGRTFAHRFLHDANKQDLEARITGSLEPHYPAVPEKRTGKETNWYLKWMAAGVSVTHVSTPTHSISYTIMSPKVAENKSLFHFFPFASLGFLPVSPFLFTLYFYFCILYLH